MIATILLLLSVLLAGCESPSRVHEPDREQAYTEMRTWFAERGIELPIQRPSSERGSPKATVDGRLLGDGVVDGWVNIFDVEGLWIHLSSPWYHVPLDLDLLDIDRDGVTGWIDLGLLGAYVWAEMADSGVSNPYGIGLPLRPSLFDIELVFAEGNEFTDRHRELFERAAVTWERIVTNDVQDRYYFAWHTLDTDDMSWWAGSAHEQWFGRIVENDLIDDVRVHATTADLGYGVNGSAQTLWFRSSSGVAINGLVVLDSEFIRSESDSHVFRTMIHELGHILLQGGEEWDERLVNRSLNADTYFKGILSRAAFESAGGGWYRERARAARKGVPVENGNYFSHWREDVLGNEIMTSGAVSDEIRPLSLITIQALADLGYEVDVSRAEPYQVPPRSAKVTAGEPRWRCGVGRYPLRGGIPE